MTSASQTDSSPEIPPPTPVWRRFGVEFLLAVILLVGAVLRFSGINWDEYTHLHPDERFLTMVETSIQPPDSISQYFNTAESPLNPRNAGHTFFVYGTLPIFLVRYLAEWIGETGYDQVHIVGRAVSATFDLISILLIFLIGSRLYRQRVGLLAAFLSAVTVLSIQHSHFFVVDPIANTFILAGFYFAVRAMDEGTYLDYALFGLALGMAVASKISAFPLAGIIVLAAAVRVIRSPEKRTEEPLIRAILGVGLAAGISILAFRVFQPYAFVGTSIVDFIRPNPDWIANLSEVRRQTSGEVDFPPALQWADRTPVLFALRNLVFWGMGAPLGILAWVAWVWALIRMIRGEWYRHILPVVWTGAFFLWQSVQFTPAMRYQLPVYPTLIILSAWALWEVWDRAVQVDLRWRTLARVGAIVLLVGVVAGTAAYAIAFAQIYTRPVTRVEASDWMFSNIPGAANLVVQTESGELYEPISLPSDYILQQGAPFNTPFETRLEGEITGILFPKLKPTESGPTAFEIVGIISSEDNSAIASGQAIGAGAEFSESLFIPFERPVQSTPGQVLNISINLAAGPPLLLQRSIIISETGWDDGLPLRLDGRDGFGSFYTGANQELYWPDDQDDDGNGLPDKLERIAGTLRDGDFLAITSNRQYGSIARVPERYPLSTAYYRALFDCPEPISVALCADRAVPDGQVNSLGYELVAVFESKPGVQDFSISDQLAEETFTVYDHPKVLIFAKTEGFSEDQVYEVLGDVSVENVRNVLPNELSADDPKSLLLPQERIPSVLSAGTWSSLFNRASIINQSPIASVVSWWLLITLIGWIAFPILFAAFSGLPDRGYPLARLGGLLVLSWGSWVLASEQIPFTSALIFGILLVLTAISGFLAWRNWEQMSEYLKNRWKYILWIEVLALGLFAFDLFVRLGNPDLWHPSKGGEKPMDFSYLNAVLKSISFPPFDPWYAGGYINYYYYGFVLVGVPIKLLGLIPSIAYNLVIPTLFSILGLAGYSVGSNLVTRREVRIAIRENGSRTVLAGLASAAGMILAGNLGTARLLYEGLRQIGATDGAGGSSSLVGIFYALRGLVRFITLQRTLPFGIDAWYWNPSRSIPPGAGEVGPITEFPFFTFLYADLHAHMIALPLTVAGLAWALSWLLKSQSIGENSRPLLTTVVALFFGSLIFGSLRATNTWDFPVYLGLGLIATTVGAWLRFRSFSRSMFADAILWTGALGILSWLLFLPYAIWYGQGYTTADLWQGSRTTVDAYLTVHGIFLFIVISWLVWETYVWMATTPIVFLSRLKPHRGLALALAISLIALILVLTVFGVSITWVVVPLIFWAGLLFLRPGTSIEKRFVLFLLLTGLGLTYVVEVIVVTGDIGRMNTVFKFYLQVWTLFSLSAGAALAWLIGARSLWSPRFRSGWTLVLGGFVFLGFLYPLTATPAKIRDRMTQDAPRSLDGMSFMQTATHFDQGQPFDLAEDYRGIQWMQDHVPGSPVIVEANIPEYRWGSRYTIYTGLPGVLGWNWHQRQQRISANEGDVMQRAFEITNFYTTQSTDEARGFIDQYGVQYVVLGQLERLYYETVEPCWPDDASPGGVRCDFSGAALGMTEPNISISDCIPIDPNSAEVAFTCPTMAFEKFDLLVDEGFLEVVYRDGATLIYQVKQ